MATLTYEKHRVLIAVNYQEQFVEALKHAIPSGYRSWESTTKIWTVYNPYMREARRLVFLYYAKPREINAENLEFAEQAQKAREEQTRRSNERQSYEDLRKSAEDFQRRYGHAYNRQQERKYDESTGTQASGNSSQAWYAALYVTPNAPIEVINAAYKALARLHHPDAPSGDTKTMQRINDAYNALRKLKGISAL